eukprot:CAMPEP_0194358108 /NCGR_PEP_ID=MMETSP0174-20130528/5440_1 /TAXON_ID=216777 /ORGANISM="Proboscia alata, Strain PI-D3" /LENGTH=831 /DNA_ID=CAMNT_0039128345 /DNA_START=100 /DNA_END=2595 /DNA_ORIENTATION=+
MKTLAIYAVCSKMFLVSSMSMSSTIFQVIKPTELTQDGGYDHRNALFGLSPFGDVISAPLFYTESLFCEWQDHISFTTDVAKKLNGTFIAMIDRGGCAFLTKVENAQISGAAAVVIADNTCLCSDTDTGNCVSVGGGGCEVIGPVMAAGGLGDGMDISIPSLLLTKKDADSIKAELLGNDTVDIEISFELPTSDYVNYEMWIDITSDIWNGLVIENFKSLVVAFGNRTRFVPKMYIYDGASSGCYGEGSNCDNLCTNNGRYCASDPDNDLSYGVSGSDVVRENLRITCIWKVYGEADGIGEKWFDYLTLFKRRCGLYDQDCVDRVLLNLDMDSERIENCMEDSGPIREDVSNAILDGMIADKVKRDIQLLPAIFVNDQQIYGSLSRSNVFLAICASFSDDIRNDINESSICQTCRYGTEEGVETCLSNKFDGLKLGDYDYDYNENEYDEEFDEYAYTYDGYDSDNDDMIGSMFENAIDSDLFDSIEQECGDNALVGSFMNPDIFDADVFSDAMKDAFKKDHEVCTPYAEKQLWTAIEEFDTCSGWDLVQGIESFPSFIVGSLQRCVGYVVETEFDDQKNDYYIREQLVVKSELQCVRDIFMGNNPMGWLLRDIFTHSDKFCSCFDELYTVIPSCTIDKWPMQLSGKDIQSNACTIRQGCQVVDELCKDIFSMLDNCLPLPTDILLNEDQVCSTRSSCDLEKYDTSLAAVVGFIGGAPLPSACVRVYQDSPLKETNILERYDGFVKNCTDGKALIWKRSKPRTKVLKESNQGLSSFWFGGLLGLLVSFTVFLLGFTLFEMRKGNWLRTEPPPQKKAKSTDSEITENTTGVLS